MKVSRRKDGPEAATEDLEWKGQNCIFTSSVYSLYEHDQNQALYNTAVCQAGDDTSVLGCAYTLLNNSGMSTWDLDRETFAHG